MALTAIEEFITRFAGRLRAEADRLRQLGCQEAAATEAVVAEELEIEFRRWSLEALTVAQASAESGYSEERLRELVREGQLPAMRDAPNGRPRILRADLPRRLRGPSGPPQTDGLDAIARKLGISR